MKRPVDETAQEWLLVGRDHEIGAIEAEYRRPGVQGVMLTGTRGVGKSRVAREAAARLGAGGCRVLWIAARSALHSTPFAALARLVPGIDCGSALLPWLISILPAAGPNRTVVVVDDAHLLDDGSAAVLAELMARRLVFLIGTAASGRRVAEPFAALWIRGRVLCVPIRPLPECEMVRLVDRLLGADLDAIARQCLVRATGGNPLALRALMDVSAPSACGDLQKADTAADSLARVLAGQWLEEAGPIVREVVEFVACAEPVAMRLLEATLGPASIDAAEQAGMVHIADDGAGPTVRLAPPLSAQLVRYLMTHSTARRVYGLLAAALLHGAPLPEEDVLRAGTWQLWAGTVTHPEYLLPAARRAMAGFDLELAGRLAAAARASSPGPGADLLIARVLSLQGRPRRAAAALPPRPPDDPGEAAAWALAAAEIRYFGLGEPAQAAERILGSVVHGRDRAEARLSWIQLADGRGGQALATARAVLARPCADPKARIWAAAAGTAAAGLLGRGALSEAIYREGTAMLDEEVRGRFPRSVEQIGYGACLARLMCGNVQQARELADRGYDETVAAGARSAAGVWAGLQGMVARAQGRVHFAARRLREALTLPEGEGLSCLKTVWTAELATVTAMAGDCAQARARLAQAEAYDTHHIAAVRPWVELARAWSHAAGGELAPAVGSVRLAAELSGQQGNRACEALALYDAARLGAAGAVRARLADLARAVDGEAVAVMATAAEGLARQDGDVLRRATDAFDCLGYTLFAAETAAAASHAHRLGARHGSAALLQERAESLAQLCDGARTPLLDRSRLRSTLTPREREVVLLAPTLTTPQIAARLGLSPRTVSNYLQRAYDKLGLTGRAELRAFFDSRPLNAAVDWVAC